MKKFLFGFAFVAFSFAAKVHADETPPPESEQHETDKEVVRNCPGRGGTLTWKRLMDAWCRSAP